jgi:hypothetical protein
VILGSNKLFARFMCGGVAARLVGADAEPFEAKLERWRVILGSNKRFASFMCNGVAARLIGADAETFEAKLERWRVTLGSNKLFAQFMCDGVAARLVGADAEPFEAKLEHWRVILGSNELFARFMCNSVAARLVGADAEPFEAKLEHWRVILGSNERFASCMCNGVASRLTDDGFNRAIVDLTTAKPELNLTTAFVFELLSIGIGSFAVRFWSMKPGGREARDALAFREAVKMWIRGALFPRLLPKYVRSAARRTGSFKKALAVREGLFLADLVE